MHWIVVSVRGVEETEQGLTCYWLVQPIRNELTFDEWMALDLQYIRDRSFWVDWKLIFQTVGVVFRMYGV